MFRYRATVEVVTTHSVFVYASSEEEAYDQLDNTDLFNEDTAIKTSVTVVDVESDGF